MLADGGRVKPVAHLYVDQRFERFAPVFGALHLPELPDPLRSPDKVGGIRLAAVSDHRIGAAVSARAMLAAKSTGITTRPRIFPACIF